MSKGTSQVRPSAAVRCGAALAGQIQACGDQTVRGRIKGSIRMDDGACASDVFWLSKPPDV